MKNINYEKKIIYNDDNYNFQGKQNNVFLIKLFIYTFQIKIYIIKRVNQFYLIILKVYQIKGKNINF